MYLFAVQMMNIVKR